MVGGGRGRITAPRQNLLCKREKYNEINRHVMLVSTVSIYRDSEECEEADGPFGMFSALMGWES